MDEDPMAVVLRLAAKPKNAEIAARAAELADRARGTWQGDYWRRVARDSAEEPDYQNGDRVKWNPTGTTWLVASVVDIGPGVLLIRLRDNGQQITVEKRHVRLVSSPDGDAN